MYRLLIEISRLLAELLPRKVVYFALIRAWAHATSGRWSATNVPAISAAEVIDRWSYDIDWRGHV